MNNNLYQWHDNYLAELEMRQLRHELEHVRMLKEADMKGDSWLMRTLKAFSRLISSGWRLLKDHQHAVPRTYTTECGGRAC